MRSWEYRVVDVFTQTPLEGNALAVFDDAAGLDDATMQKIARETNLSETTFVFPPVARGSAARVRIFTPSKEMLFAGHPTVGTAWVLRERGRVPKDQRNFVLDENVGPVSIRVDDDGLIWLRTPPIRTLREYDPALCAAAVGLERRDLLEGVWPQNVSAGNPLVFIALRDAATVDRARVDTAALRQLLAGEAEPTCIFVFTPTQQGAYSRMFAEDLGIVEDPATGSATGPLAAFMIENGLVSGAPDSRFVSEQGTKMGRRSLLHVYVRGERGAGGIEVGGHVAPVATATLTLP
ncbi:MAG TPA: PhzF family phenazine biosynthesis protein [Candidatus Cybelea sp.]|jgi:trans-2,3-dihydro-3-hydroxyanthranilate isomerase|nr:PhzF family phenazine biosynthesis protein [Candidatus Cybelea sp.]